MNMLATQHPPPDIDVSMSVASYSTIELLLNDDLRASTSAHFAFYRTKFLSSSPARRVKFFGNFCFFLSLEHSSSSLSPTSIIHAELLLCCCRGRCSIFIPPACSNKTENLWLTLAAAVVVRCGTITRNLHSLKIGCGLFIAVFSFGPSQRSCCMLLKC